MTGEPRSRVPALLVVLGALLLVGAVAGALTARDSTTSPAAPTAMSQPSALQQTIQRTQDALRRNPGNAPLWAQLGASYVEQARISGDPSYYGQAEGALDRSLAVEPDGNGEALIGLAQLANARHDFAAARDLGERARELRPYTGAVYGVLADAYTQLGDTAAASAAIESMLGVDPGLAAFTRASYDLELHGRADEARQAMQRALSSALTPADVAYCRYYLGELAWNAGDVDGAAEHYAAGLVAAPHDVALAQGQARIAWAQGRVDDAITAYADLTTRVPLPQYLLEYGELLESAGRADEARAQYDVLAAAQQLYASSGSTDDQVAALVAADHGDPAEALRLAQGEWDRRQSMFSADALAWALHVNGRDAEALPFAELASATGWRNATHAYHRGMILAGLDRREDAIAALDEALAINPNFHPLHAPDAVATRTRLESGA
ncbi:tetratricopeptide repeat protein [Pseudonocardia petroleophila]|uniref:Tetratricopeptide repeat protein n=1 Tax=Pseudonocardia petroleophila TaxID=37331 RepID=A0A7G7MPM7_9PSEU|nr:tetratricopeptide repeat protein [Pseudonocardia petroleophila]QNG54738.1 tetratricopeptide repeat protein [Pseudonocardia petroleophila]